MFAYFPKTLSFGNICFSYPEFISVHLKPFGAAPGVLGLEYLSCCFDSFTLDLKNKSIIFNDDIPDVKGVTANTDWWLVIPVKINGKTYNAMLDTGNGPTYTYVDLWDDQLEKFELTGVTWEGDSKFQVSRKKLKDVVIGDTVIEKITFDRVHETESSIYNSIKESGQVDIILGSEFFLRAKVTVDTKNNMCYVVPNGK